MNSESVKNVFIKGILSGVLIGIGCIIFLIIDNKYLGSFLFSFGLFTIIQRWFALYSGKVGYIPENKPCYIKEVLMTLVGNVTGTFISTIFIGCKRQWKTIHRSASDLMNIKISDSVFSTFFLAAFCGILMYLAVENGRICKIKGNDLSLVFGTVLPIMIFILSGFNHSIADCFYMFSAGVSVRSVLYILVVILGNAFGCMFIPILKKFFDK